MPHVAPYMAYPCSDGAERAGERLLSLVVHLIYRAKTQRFQRSWLDFVVAEENGKPVAKSIGKFYYAAILLNTILW